MTKKPPLPEEVQSPYPIAESPHDGADNETVAAVKELAAARKRRLQPTRTQIGIGAAVGIGSAAIVAGLLYWRGNHRK
ncbi:hypothetical protein [Sphingomonas sp. dw_22]|uniref:hypothetical protein n=1 Tax=Sphingomonas sp. dw_22 TaxID=2721175 RepID=UPI001BD2A92E|nr:hypothetical protein [Sphingomonas sp. dw_22]